MDADGLAKVAATTPQRPYTVRQFAELAGLGRNSVYAMVARGSCPHCTSAAPSACREKSAIDCCAERPPEKRTPSPGMLTREAA